MTAPQAGGPKARYFYRDPLAAAWMAKHFGMRFTNLGLDDKLNPEYSRVSSQFYIHADSLPLLEPKIGDAVQNPDGDVSVVCREHWRGYGMVKISEATQYVGDAAIIIQRDGKPFHWPESEAA